MIERDRHIANASFVDTPRGMFTAAGVWFRTTREDVERYAGDVLEHESLEHLITQAEVWLRSAQTLTVWLLPVFLAFLPPLSAAGAAMTVFVGSRTLGPSLVSRWVERVLRVLDLVWLQGAFYVATLSFLAAQAHFIAVWGGLAGFILLRWGAIEKVTDVLVRMFWNSLYEMPVADQVLRSFIVRAAMKYGVALPQLEELERRIVERFSRH